MLVQFWIGLLIGVILERKLLPMRVFWLWPQYLALSTPSHESSETLSYYYF